MNDDYPECQPAPQEKKTFSESMLLRPRKSFHSAIASVRTVGCAKASTNITPSNYEGLPATKLSLTANTLLCNKNMYICNTLLKIEVKLSYAYCNYY